MSSPKQKAKELVEIYYQKIIDLVDVNNALYYSQQCALIAVDEIIALNLQYSDIEYGGINSYEFWEQVKTEIENI
jgi:hypothetical protein